MHFGKLHTQFTIQFKVTVVHYIFLAHQSEGSWGAYSIGLEPATIRPSTLSNMNISETGRPIVIKFHLEHNWGGGLTALGFGLDRIRTLVSMATDSSHRVIMGKSCDHSNAFIF